VNFYKQERLALFIDGASLHGVARVLGFEIDYRKLFDLFARKTRLIRACYYTTVVENGEYSPLRPIIDWLQYNSYTVVTKPVREYIDSWDQLRVKGSIHVDLAVDALDMAEQLDHIVLVSGDGDFRRLVAAIQRRGVRVTVLSTLKSKPPVVSDELRRQADGFIEIMDLIPDIQRLIQQTIPAAASTDA